MEENKLVRGGRP